MEIRRLVLDAVTEHWHSHNRGGLTYCNCGKPVDDINDHTADEVLKTLYPLLKNGQSFDIRWQYGEVLTNGRILPFPDGDTSGPSLGTHRRRIIISKDWEKL